MHSHRRKVRSARLGLPKDGGGALNAAGKRIGVAALMAHAITQKWCKQSCSEPGQSSGF